MVVELILAGKRFLGGDKNEGETGGHDFGITISRATILMILSAPGYYPVSPFRGKSQLNFSDEIPRVAIMASKQSHCLLDLLWRASIWNRGCINGRI